MDFTKTFHVDTYTRLSPERPELSQAGRTVFISGGAPGIGLQMSRSFQRAGASRLVLMGRRAEPLAEAKKNLEAKAGGKCEVVTYSGDVTNAARMQQIWDDLKARDIGVDVLILNAGAANSTPGGLEEVEFVTKVWSMFEINVYSAVVLCDLFLKQGPAKGRAIVSLNAGAAHLAPVRQAQIGYAPSKAALGSFISALADHIDPQETQIVSYHPGSIRTEAVLKSALANARIAWNTDALSGDFAVWAASKEANFLHGRLIWCMWDVEELMAMKGDFAHPGYCRIGLQGPKPLSTDELWTQMSDFRSKIR